MSLLIYTFCTLRILWYSDKCQCLGLPVMGGGSTTVDGPKKDGISPDVVTGVLRSPG